MASRDRRRTAVVAAVLAAVALLCLYRLVRPRAPSAEERAAVAFLNARALTPWRDVRTLSGQVVTPAGRGVANAEVMLIGRGHRGERERAATVRTDATGQFRFAEVSARLRKYAWAGLLVRAPGWGLSFGRVTTPEAEAQVVVYPPGELQATFVDEQGEPVPGLRVEVRSLWREGGAPNSASLTSELRGQLTRTTDSRGRCSFPGLPQGAGVRLDVEDPRFAHLEAEAESQVTLAAAPTTSFGPVTVRPGASIGGRVTYRRTGKPAAGVEVNAQSEDGGGRATTDAQGRYTIRGLSVGGYNVSLFLSEEMERHWTAVARAGVSVAAGGQADGVDLQLIPGAVITGRALTRDGLPLAGIFVAVYGPAHPRSTAGVQATWTRADGSYLLRVPAGQQYLYLSGGPPPGFSMPQPSKHDLFVADGQTVTVDFTFPGRAMQPVFGRVLGPDGKPVAGAEVVPLRQAGLFVDAPIVKTNARGEYRLPPENVILRARAGTSATLWPTPAGNGGKVDLHLARNALGSVSGVARDAKGRPLSRAEVQIDALYANPEDPSTLWHRGSGLSRSGPAVRTGLDGSFLVTGLWPHQRYTVSLGGAWKRQHSETFEVKPGERAHAEPRAW